MPLIEFVFRVLCYILVVLMAIMLLCIVAGVMGMVFIATILGG